MKKVAQAVFEYNNEIDKKPAELGKFINELAQEHNQSFTQAQSTKIEEISDIFPRIQGVDCVVSWTNSF